MSKTNPNPYVIVDNAGTDDEDIVIDFPTFEKAHAWLKKEKHYWNDLQIMKRRNDGLLTTEY